MREIILRILILALCLALCTGCQAEEEAPPETIGALDVFYRVKYVGEGEFIAYGDGGEILVKYPQADLFEVFDTVVIEFDIPDLKPESGTRLIYEEHKVSYSHVLENPKLVRHAGPGEPTFA